MKESRRDRKSKFDDRKPDRFEERKPKREGRRFNERSSSPRFDERPPARFSERPPRDFDRRPRSSELEFHQVICDKCGKKCEVPFKPTSSKPVYCSDCFKKRDHFDSRGSGSGSSDELAAINQKLDKIMRALEIE
jgi:CxxC-x17-CxxC domain-containing protein